MRVHEMIVAEREHMADLFAGLSEEQLARQSLCEAWTVHEVGAHLVAYLRLRAVALPQLDGDGVAILGDRLNQASRAPVPQRLMKMATTVLRPSPRRAAI